MVFYSVHSHMWTQVFKRLMNMQTMKQIYLKNTCQFFPKLWQINSTLVRHVLIFCVINMLFKMCDTIVCMFPVSIKNVLCLNLNNFCTTILQGSEIQESFEKFLPSAPFLFNWGIFWTWESYKMINCIIGFLDLIFLLTCFFNTLNIDSDYCFHYLLRKFYFWFCLY